MVIKQQIGLKVILVKLGGPGTIKKYIKKLRLKPYTFQSNGQRPLKFQLIVNKFSLKELQIREIKF